MKKSRPTYSAEFKKDAVELILNKNYSFQEACNATGVGPTALRRWVAQLKTERTGGTPNAKAISSEQQKVQQLEARVKQIEWENSILKKATALLVSDSIKP